MFKDKDVYFLKKTFSLAKKAEGFTSPNPLVGAIIVKGNRVIAEGYHRGSWLPHAEIEAMSKSKDNLEGATLYINLEPCCHFGKTPPCVDRLIKSGIKRVVVSNIDPNPKVRGASIRKLKNVGIDVKTGLCRKEGERLNEVFFKNMRLNLPFVVFKIAQSLDGKIATKAGISKWITDKKARIFAKSLRDKYDAVLVGVNTVIKDNPTLNGLKKVPFKIVIDKNLNVPRNCNLFKYNSEKLIIITSVEKRKSLRKIPASVKVLLVEPNKDGNFCLIDILKTLYNLGICSVLVEGGSYTAGKFFDERLIDKLYIFIAPKIIGGKDALTSIGGSGFIELDSCLIKDVKFEYVGKDILISGYPYYGKN